MVIQMKSYHKKIIIVFLSSIIFLQTSFLLEMTYFGEFRKMLLEDEFQENLRESDTYWHPYLVKNVGMAPNTVFVGDVDNDGDNDLVTANEYSHDISIYLWDSLIGMWRSERRIAVGSNPYHIFVGDVNNDGYNDIVNVNEVSNTISILLWNSSLGDWNPKIDKDVGISPYSVSIGDVDNDGDNDIITASLLGGSGNAGLVSMYLWNATSEDWDPKITRQGGLAPSCVFVEDANNDGHNDIVAGTIGSDQIAIFLWNTTLGDWETPILKSAGDNPRDIFVGDANNDGYNDIVTANNYDNDISLYIWNNTLGDWNPQKKITVGTYPYGVFIGDSNNDGYNDMAVTCGGTGLIHLFLWNSSISDWNPEITLYRGNQDVFIEDANNDGVKDIVSVYANNDGLYILLTISDSRFISMNIREQFFSTTEFNLTFFISDESDHGLDSVDIQMWWNGSDVSSDFHNLGNGYYSVSLEPITVEEGENPILLNMTINTIGYVEEYIETYFSVKQCDLIDLLHFQIINQEFTKDDFTFTMYLYDVTEEGVDNASMQILWNGTDVSSNIESLGLGMYKLTLEPIFVELNGAPILLEFYIEAEGYNDLEFSVEIAVDPDPIKIKSKTREFPFMPIITAVVLVSFLTLSAVFIWFRRKIRIKS